MKPVAILQYYVNDGPGFLADHLRERGVANRVFHLFNADAAPASLDGFSGLCLLGGPMSVNDDWQPLREGERLVLEALRVDVPVFGHCLGGQLMSRALGGRVQRAACAEIGWSDVEACRHPMAQYWFGSVRFPMFQWHSETFSIPSGADWVAHGKHCAHQAFCIGDRHLGVQFHCEIDAAKIETWLEDGESADIDRFHESPAVQQRQQIRAALSWQLPEAQRAAAHMYDRWLQRLAR